MTQITRHPTVNDRLHQTDLRPALLPAAFAAGYLVGMALRCLF